MNAHEKGTGVRGAVLRGLRRTALCVSISLVSLAVFLFGAVRIVHYGPSPAARDLLVTTAMETSAAHFLATWFLSDSEISEILSANAVEPASAVTDTSPVAPAVGGGVSEQENDIEIEDVTGPTFKGKMMIVRDPSRVYVATPDAFGLPSGGMRVGEMMERDGAVAGVNGGGFADENGVGDGGAPIGIVISQGELKNGSLDATYEIIGFDSGGKLLVGPMTARQALERSVRDAVGFGPALIVNGQAARVSGIGGGLNPRTAIGQRADGAVLLLVVDGRQPHSLGAGFGDLIGVMTRYGAVNAANLDGGSSSLMMHEGELITSCASLYGPRKLPTAVLVRAQGGQEGSPDD